MKERAIYYRRKNNKIIAEGKMKNKTIYLFTIPAPEKIINSSLFTQENREKIMEKITRLDYKSQRKKKQEPKVRTTNIKRSPKEDDNFNPDEEINLFKERVEE